MWWTFFLISVGCLVLPAAILLAIKSSKWGNKRKIGVLNALLAGVFAANIFVFLPIHIVTAEPTFWGAWRAFLLSVFHSMQVFTIGCEFSAVKEGMAYCPNVLDAWYQVWAATLFVLAPILTFGFVLSLFKNLSAYVKYLRSYFKRLIFFLN